MNKAAYILGYTKNHMSTSGFEKIALLEGVKSGVVDYVAKEKGGALGQIGAKLFTETEKAQAADDWLSRSWKSAKKAGFDPSALWDADTYKGIWNDTGAFFGSIFGSKNNALAQASMKTVDAAKKHGEDIVKEMAGKKIGQAMPWVLGGGAALLGGGLLLKNMFSNNTNKQTAGVQNYPAKPMGPPPPQGSWQTYNPSVYGNNGSNPYSNGGGNPYG